MRPNLQHIPRSFDISDGRTIQVRKAFVAVPGKATFHFASFVFFHFLKSYFLLSLGSTLLSADYSQLELRILAHLSGDKGLCSVLSRHDGDVFRSITAAWKKKNEQDVTEDERQQAKQICYGIIYG